MTAQNARKKTEGRGVLTFVVLLRLLRHLRRGGSRRGACGWSGVPYRELAGLLAQDSRLAEALEKAEARSMARDERRLDQKVSKGSQESLLFRMRHIYSYGKDSRAGDGADGGNRQAGGEYTKAEKAIAALDNDKRKELAGAYREASAA